MPRPRPRSISPPRQTGKIYALHIFHPEIPVIELPLDAQAAVDLLSTLTLRDVKHLSAPQLTSLTKHLSSLGAADADEAWLLEAVDAELEPATLRRRVVNGDPYSYNSRDGDRAEVTINTWKAKTTGATGVFSAVFSRKAVGRLGGRVGANWRDTYAVPMKPTREEVWFVEEPAAPMVMTNRRRRQYYESDTESEADVVEVRERVVEVREGKEEEEEKKGEEKTEEKKTEEKKTEEEKTEEEKKDDEYAVLVEA